MITKNKLLSVVNLVIFAIVWIVFIGVVFYLIGTLFYVSGYWYGDVPKAGVSYFYWGVVSSPISILAIAFSILAAFYFLIRWIIYSWRGDKGRARKALLLASVMLFVAFCFLNIWLYFRGGTHHDSITYKQQGYHLSYGTTGWCCGDCLTTLIIWECDRFGIICQGKKVERSPSTFMDYVSCDGHIPSTEQLPALDIDPATDGLYLKFKEGDVYLNGL